MGEERTSVVGREALGLRVFASRGHHQGLMSGWLLERLGTLAAQDTIEHWGRTGCPF